MYRAEWEEYGGYDCMSDAWIVRDNKNLIVCVIDEADHDNAEQVARLIAQRLSS